MTRDDPLYPFTRWLRSLAKDAANISADTLRLFLGIREAGRVRGDLKFEMTKLKQQLARTVTAFDRLDGILDALDKNAGETSEHELIGLVLQLSEKAEASEQFSKVLALDHIALAHRILKMPPDRFPEVVRELNSFEGGKEQLTEFFAAVWRFYGNELKAGE